MQKKKAIIIIGGSHLQLPQILWAKELGLHTVVTDWNPEALGRMHADSFEIISGIDITSLLELARRINNEYQLAGAYASSDFGLKAVAAINEKFNLPGCSKRAVERSIDKSKLKDLLIAENVPMARGVTVNDIKDLHSASEKLCLPLIIKPANSSGSQGVKSVRYRQNLEEAFNAARKFSSTVLVEQLIDGYHIDVNGMFIEGEFIRCGIMERFFSEPPYHYPLWGYQPSSLTDMHEDEVFRTVEKAARTLGIEAGPVKADVIWSADGPVILEVTPRFHGDVITSYTTPIVSGSSPIYAYFAHLSGVNRTYDHNKKEENRFAGWRALFPAGRGVLRGVSEKDKAMDIKGIRDIYISVKNGVRVKGHIDNSSLCGFIWAAGNSVEELRNSLETASSTIHFEIEND